jgi:hypothetical protein
MPSITLAWPQPGPPFIRYFQIVREVLEESISELVSGSGKNRNEICEAIRAQFDICYGQWFSNAVPQIDYKNPLCRLAYLYAVAPSIANIIERVFARDDELREHFEKACKENGSVSICAFGGGPGTELLGVCKWAELSNPKEPIQLEYLLLDRVNEWMDSWNAIRKRIRSRAKKHIGKDRQNSPLEISGMFSAIDIGDTKGLVNLGNVFDHDLFILSYLVSEIFANFEKLQNFAEQIVDRAPEGAKFLFVDRKGNRWKNEINKLAEKAGIGLSAYHDTQGTMDMTERASDLGSLPDEIGIPTKLTWSAFWVIGTKK